MHNLLDLPTALVALVLATVPVSAQSAPQRPDTTVTTLPTAPATGSGSAYVSACLAARSAYASGSSAWDSANDWASKQTHTYGGTQVDLVTYYEGASTLCDGHARVAYSPAKSLSTGLITHPGVVSSTHVWDVTRGWMYPAPSPSCSISPSDCNPLWSSYSASLTAWQMNNISRVANTNGSPPRVTAAPERPPCFNEAQASSNAAFQSSLYGCGSCTIFGDQVQLVYFPVPTTVSRDMCASTPAANLTYYNSDAVIEAYAGTAYRGNGSIAGQVTATAGGHTFTSGTAYISIGSIWAVDRCQNTVGTPVTSAILAMSSQNVLSLRYRQNHFEYFAETDTQTGYPISYADFHSPVPYSAWNGQEACDYGGWQCQVIYDGQYKPQLAIPPGIKKLNPDWEGCQMWYGGLWDPPLALQPVSEIAQPTLPGGHHPQSTHATPGRSPSPSTPVPTALPDNTGHPSSNWGGGNQPSEGYQPDHRPTNTHGDDWSHPSHVAGDHNNGQNDDGSGSVDQDPSNTEGGDVETVTNEETFVVMQHPTGNDGANQPEVQTIVQTVIVVGTHTISTFGGSGGNNVAPVSGNSDTGFSGDSSDETGMPNEGGAYDTGSSNGGASEETGYSDEGASMETGSSNDGASMQTKPSNGGASEPTGFPNEGGSDSTAASMTHDSGSSRPSQSQDSASSESSQSAGPSAQESSSQQGSGSRNLAKEPLPYVMLSMMAAIIFL